MKYYNLLYIVIYCFLIISCSSNSNNYTEQDVTEILGKYTKAMGKARNLNSVKTFYMITEQNGQAIETFIEARSRFFQKMGEGENKTMVAVENKKGYFCLNKELHQVDESVLVDYEEDLYIFRLFNARKRGWQFELTTNNDDKKNILLIGKHDKMTFKTQFYIDNQTYLINKIVRNNTTIRYLDYKDFSGIKYPQTFESTDAHGNKSIFKVKKIILNEKFKVDQFDIKKKCNELN